MAEYDVVIRGGTVIDGSGGLPQPADVAIAAGRIVAVGSVPGHGQEEIDARGCLVTPGFVDLHTHYDAQVTWEQRLSPSSEHGVTTAVMGNCAIGVAPCHPDQHELLARVIAGVEDIPEAVLQNGIPWTWETFPEYLDFLAQRQFDMDVITQIPHSAIRVYVMGQRGADRESATGKDLAQMTALVNEAVQAGAFGVSTSRTLSHRTRDGALAPAETASEEELLALARGLKQAGRGVFEAIVDFNDIDLGASAEFDMLRRIAQVAECPVSFTVVQRPNEPNDWRTLLALLDQANQDGLAIRGQIAPKAVGMLFGLDLSFNPFSFYPSYRAIEHLPLPERVAALRRPDTKATLLAEQPSHTNPLMLWLTSLVESMYPLGNDPDYEPSPEDSIGATARRLGRSATDYAYDLLLEQEGKAMLFLPITNYVDGNLDNVLTMLNNPHTLIALGDGGAHLGLICDASYSTFTLTHWVRDRKRGARVPLPWAVHALTRRNALAIGLTDRGLVAAGMKADINVIDFEHLKLHAPSVAYDLPGGGRRVTQKADGYVATLVNGVVTYREGQPTGALPGRLVRSSELAI